MSETKTKKLGTCCSCGSCGPVSTTGQGLGSTDPGTSDNRTWQNTVQQDRACNANFSCRRLMMVLGLILVLVVVGIVFSKLSGETTNPLITNDAGQDSTQTIIQNKIGIVIKSLNDLNQLAMSQDAAFIYIPGTKDVALPTPAIAAMYAAKQSLESLDIVIGIYTLSPGSEDYYSITAQVPIQSFIVSSKGGKLAPVYGNINRDAFLLAYMNSTSSTTCGPSGCN